MAYVWTPFRWRPPDQSSKPGDSGSLGMKLLCTMQIYAIHSGVRRFTFGFIYEEDKTLVTLPVPHPFDSAAANIQPDEKNTLWYQAGTLRSVVRYLESTLQCQLYPRYKKTNASLFSSAWIPPEFGGWDFCASIYALPPSSLNICPHMHLCRNNLIR